MQLQAIRNMVLEKLCAAMQLGFQRQTEKL